jgi:hypothetical protein
VRVILLYSCTSSLVTCFTFSELRSLKLCQSASDPFMLSLGITQKRSADSIAARVTDRRKKFPSSLLLLPATFINLPWARHSEEEYTSLHALQNYYHTITLHNDLSVSSRLWTFPDCNSRYPLEDSRRLAAHSRTAFPTSSVYSNVPRSDDFTVQEREQSMGASASTRINRSWLSRGLDQWVVDFQWLAKSMSLTRSVAKHRATSTDSPSSTLQAVMEKAVQYRGGVHVL